MSKQDLLPTDEEYKELVGYIPIPEHDLRKVTEFLLAKVLKHYKYDDPDYDPQAKEFGWYLEHGWLPPAEVERLKESPAKLQCKDCGWVGAQEDCIRYYIGMFGIDEGDVELCLECPECGSDSLIDTLDLGDEVQ